MFSSTWEDPACLNMVSPYKSSSMTGVMQHACFLTYMVTEVKHENAVTKTMTTFCHGQAKDR
jgi:hypothetical protein